MSNKNILLYNYHGRIINKEATKLITRASIIMIIQSIPLLHKTIVFGKLKLVLGYEFS